MNFDVLGSVLLPKSTQNRPKWGPGGSWGGLGAPKSTLGLTFAPEGDQRRPKTIIAKAWQTTWVDFGGHLGPPKEPEIKEKLLFVVTFCRMRFFSPLSKCPASHLLQQSQGFLPLLAHPC